ncbi:hypothetical protein ACWCW7_06920 [Nocardia tengchongensis]
MVDPVLIGLAVARRPAAPSSFAALADHKRLAHPSGWQRVVDWFDDL